MNTSMGRLAMAGLLTGLAPVSTFACASCGCSLSADAAMGYSASAGWRASLEYDYINQDELRSGTRAVSKDSGLNNAFISIPLGRGRVGQCHEHRNDAMLGQRHRGGNIGAERGAIDFGGLFGVLDGNRYMIEPAQHDIPLL